MTDLVRLRESEATPLANVIGVATPGSEVGAVREVVETIGRQLRDELGLRTDALSVTRESDGLTLRANGIAGTVRVGNVTLDIRPKHVAGEDIDWQPALLFMLERASRRRFRFYRSTQLGLDYGRTFADRLASGYAMQLEEATRHAEVRQYRGSREELGHVRGRMLLSEQLRSSLTKPHRVICEVDSLSADNPVNQLLHWAARQLDSLATDPRVRRGLSVAAGRLPAVTPIAAAPNHLSCRLPRQYHHYLGALELATALAHGMTTVHGASDVAGAGYVVGTERLYESFLERSLELSLAREEGAWTVAPQVREKFAEPVDKGKSYFSTPDNVVRRGGVAVLVVDAKYKQFSDATEGTDRPSNADLYQMAAACVAHRCGRALLVYPRLPVLQGDEDLGASWQPRWWRIALPSSGEVMVGAAAVPLDWLNDGDRAERFDQKLADLVVTASGVSA